MAVGLHEPATLNCKSDGHPQPEVRWYRDGRQVDVATSVRKALLPDGSLLFLEASQGKRDSDSGTYWCIAHNAFGEAVSRKANLVVTCKYTYLSSYTGESGLIFYRTMYNIPLTVYKIITDEVYRVMTPGVGEILGG